MFLRFGIMILCLLTLGTFSHAQSKVLPSKDNTGIRKGIIYHREYAVNVTLHSNGFRMGYDWGRIKTYYKTTYYHFDFGNLRHPKEVRQNVNYQSNLNIANSYSYGKRNYFYLARGGWGEKRYLSEKARYRGIAVGYNYELGPTLGIIKPYYLSFAKRVDGQIVIEELKYSEEVEDLFLDPTRIQGKSGFFKGWNEVSVTPGLHAKLGAHFALGAFESYVSALEAGLMMDVFFQEIPIMVSEDNRRLFVNVYVTLQLGKRK